MATPHDKLFREVFQRPVHAASLLRSILPAELARAIDWRRLRRRRGSFVDGAARQHHADLLFSAPVGKREVLLYLLLEHKSSSERFTALQLLGYVVAVWQAHRQQHRHAHDLPPVVPIVIHHDDHGFSAPTSLRALVALGGLPRGVASVLSPLQPDFTFLLDDLAHASEADLDARSLSTVAHLSLLLLQHARHRPPAQALAAIMRWRDLVRAIGRAPSGQRRLFLLWSYLLAVTEVRPEHLQRIVVEILDDAAGVSVMSTADKLIAKGRREGRATGRAEGQTKGRAEGRSEGIATVLLRQLTTRFGPLPDAVIARVRSGSASDVDVWAVRVLDAGTLDEVFRDR